MAKYTVTRTDTADAQIHKIILYIAKEYDSNLAGSISDYGYSYSSK